MKFIKFNLIMISLILVIGCATTHEHKNNNFPQLTSEKFPSYPVDSPIIEEIEVKIPKGGGKTKISMDITLTKGSNSVKSYSEINWLWHIFYREGIIANRSYMFTDLRSMGRTERFYVNIDIQHDIYGNEKLMKAYYSHKDVEFTKDQLNIFKMQMSKHIKNLFDSIGKKVKTGDAFPENHSNLYYLQEISKADIINSTIPEIIKGWGTYMNKKVIVTETIIDDKINRPNLKMDARGKGYRLYDSESFIFLAGKYTAYANITTPQKGTLTVKIESNSKTKVNRTSIIDSSKVSDWCKKN